VASTDLADVALIKLKNVPADLAVATLGNSDKVRIGEKVFAVCASCGEEHTLAVRHISGRSKSEALSDLLIPLEFLQTDGVISEEYNGGPMFNMNGEVVGIVSTILSDHDEFDEVGIAASINNAKELLLKGKSFWTGLDVFLLSGPIARALNVPQEAGFLIQRVAAKSPGDRLGLKPGNIPVEVEDEELIIGGDIVLEVQGIKVSTDIEMLRKIQEVVQERPGLSRTEFKVLRDGKIVNLFLSD
jgi:S1-C subfamily serine protease